ncbi:GH13787 [Drosophila grimshawi]|uniref:GH13787 n=1 Tax=Drosophila grimshawi TaxID=7222 RepID=B4JQZ4_DROGR|nr:GH13787 [Drosophila grimshawi]
MLHHANLRGSPQQFGQGRRIQVDNAAKLANYYEQLNERRDWLFSLGLIGRRAHDLAVQTLELPEFNLDHFQQRVNRLSLQLGSSRLAAVDAIIVDEIRELMKHQRTPSSPRVTNFNLSCRNTSDYDQRTVDFQTDDIYTDHRMYSAPVRALELRRQTYDAHRGSPQVYNIEDDPRNFDDAPRVEQKTQFVPYWNNNNYNNVDHCCEHNFEDAYNIEADSRNIENNFPKPQFKNDFRGRKRAAQPNYKPNNHSGPKRRKMNEPNQIFRIRDFEMPYIKNDTKPLPQPEHKSYAIKFFQHMKDTAKLEHIIRNVPNHLWTYKMRGMVYLWSRYSKIRTNSIDSNKFFATQMQWSSPTFHWLAKQAYEELKTISQIEWPEHNETYALL